MIIALEDGTDRESVYIHLINVNNTITFGIILIGSFDGSSERRYLWDISLGLLYRIRDDM